MATGAARCFWAGAGMEDLSVLDDPQEVSSVLERPRMCAITVRKPLIAAMNSAAAGLGLIEALYCNIRFCTPRIKVTTRATGLMAHSLTGIGAREGAASYLEGRMPAFAALAEGADSRRP